MKKIGQQNRPSQTISELIAVNLVLAVVIYLANPAADAWNQNYCAPSFRYHRDGFMILTPYKNVPAKLNSKLQAVLPPAESVFIYGWNSTPELVLRALQSLGLGLRSVYFVYIHTRS